LVAIVMTTNVQAGRAGVRLALVVVLLALAGYAAWSFANRQQGGPVSLPSAATAASAHQKAQAFEQAHAQAQQTGRPVRVVETFGDAELSSLANDEAQARGMPVDQISLHATSQGTVQGRAQAHVAGQTLPVTMEGVPVVSDNRVALNVTSTQVGSIPLPGPITDQVTESLRQPLMLGQPITGFQDLRVAVSTSQITVSGVAQPG
jgi:hypothetical protein